MLQTVNEMASGAEIKADVCIVGSGPAGLTLARELAGAPFKVLLVESGDFRSRRKLKQLNEGTTFGDHYPNPRWQRMRRVGGCANRWLVDIGQGRMGARYVPLDAVDFEARSWMPHSGWPVGRAELDPYYERAHHHCGIGAYRYDLAAWSAPSACSIETEAINTGFFQFGPQDRWTGRHDELFDRTANLDVLLNATVTEIETDEDGGRASSLSIVDDAQRRFRVHARLFVLAVGCIETTRLLLNSRSRHTAALGNGHDVVGRYFMDHPQSYLNVFRPADPSLFDRAGIYDLKPRGPFAVMAKLGLREDVLRREPLPNSCHLLFPRRDHFLSDAFQSFFSLVLDVKHMSPPRQLVQRLGRMAKGAGDLLPIAAWALQGKAHYPYLSKGGWADLEDKSRLFTTFEVWSMVEQAPDPANRITLSCKRDYNDMPTVEIHWRFTQQDRAGVVRLRERLRHEIEGAGLGTLDWSPDPFTTPSSVHPIGGARMGQNPRTSVVGPDLSLHAVRNLFVAGSAVFPTSGYANPTLTVVALACRLADRIKHVLSLPSEVRALPRG